MEEENGGRSTWSQRQRQAAAELARKRVLRAYEKEDKTLDWQKYHAAWQNYYQKYYSDFYLRAAQDYIIKEQSRVAPAKYGKAQTAAEIAARNEAILRAKGMIKGKTDFAAGVKGEPGQLIETVKTKLKRERHPEILNWVETDGVPQPNKDDLSEAETESAKRSLLLAFKAKIQEKASEKAAEDERRRRWQPIIIGGATMLAVLFLQYNRLIFAPIYAYVSPGPAPAAEISEVDPTVTLTKVSEAEKLLIPKLNVEVPIIFGVDFTEVMEAMNRGVAHYRIAGADAYPGQVGNFVITGHSAGDIYSSNQYKFIFSGLERLETGDLLYVHYGGVRYTYRMVGREIVEPTEIAKLTFQTDKPMLTLVTCYPLGTSRQRLLVFAEQISPNYSQTEIADQTAGGEAQEMPRNERTLFERIGAWFKRR